MFFATVAREGVFCAGCRLLFLLGCQNLGEVLLAAVFSATGSSAAISGGFCMGWGSGAADDGAGRRAPLQLYKSYPAGPHQNNNRPTT